MWSKHPKKIIYPINFSTQKTSELSVVLPRMGNRYNNKSNFFLINFMLLLGATTLLLLILKWLNSIMKSKNI